MLVPKLRFKEFTDEWKQVELEKIVKRIIRKNKNNESQLPLTISAQYGLIDQTSFFNRNVSSSDLSGYYLLYNGDFAYNKSYSNGYPWGTVKKLTKYDKGVVSSLYICFKNNENISANYLEQYFETSKWYKEISLVSVEGARNHGLLNISVNDFFASRHYIPQKIEQNKIGDFLSLIDKKIELQSKKIEALKLYKKGLLNFKYNSLNAHNYVSLGEIAKIYQPQTLSQSSLDYGKYNVFGANGIIGKHSKYNHKLEQVTISCRGENAGIINITPELCWINGNSMVINIDNNINYNKFFLKYILEKQNLKYMISGSGQPQITREVVLKHKIPNLTLPTQLQFIRELIIIDKKIRLENIKYNYTISLKKGLMQNMFV